MTYEQGRSRVLSHKLGAPALGTATAVHAAVTDTGAPSVITTGFTQPDVPRNVTATTGGTAADIKAVQVVVEGTNVHGDAITETLPAFTADAASTKSGSKAFKTITKVTIPAHDGTGATTSVGLGTVLGLRQRLVRNTVVGVFLDNVKEASPTVAVSGTAVESNTVSLATALNGVKSVVVDYYR